MSDQEKDQAQTEQPADGPDEGGTSQDAPPDSGKDSSQQARVEQHSPPPQDSNEKADSRVDIVEPDGKPSPRA